MNLLMVAALNHLWSMLNGLQISTHMQLFNLKFPANAGFLLNFLVNVATFDVMPIEGIWFFFDLPERGAFSLSFASSGYEYTYLVENMGTCFFVVQIYLSSCIIAMLLLLLIRYAKLHKLQNIYESLKKNLFWSTALRFVFESYLELTICVTIGLLNLDWSQSNFSIVYNTIWTISWAFIVLILPLFSSIFYYCRIDQVEDEKFTD